MTTVYKDPHIHTLNHALRTLYSIEQPSLIYTQRLEIQNLYTDLAYSTYVEHRRDHEILSLTFPKECESIQNVKNNYGCPMICYHTINQSVIQGYITPSMTIEIVPNTTVIIYTRSKNDLAITFDMMLSKTFNRSMVSKL